jgi:uncharacterized delta-60 repeat protein
MPIKAHHASACLKRDVLVTFKHRLSSVLGLRAHLQQEHFMRSNPNACAIHRLEPRRLVSAGDLDPTFGTDGVAHLFEIDRNGPASPLIAVPDANHKMLVASLQNLARYNTDGSLDTSFGTAGHADAAHTTPEDLDVAPDGSIILTAVDDINLEGSDLPFHNFRRYTPAGQLDQTFGDHGILNLDPLVGADNIPATAIAPDGKIVLLAESQGQPLQMIRLNADGSLDASFSNVSFDEDNVSEPTGLIVQSDGKIVLTSEELSYQANSFKVIRFTNTGALDTTFASGGMLNLTQVSVPSAELLPDGKLLLTGEDASDNAVFRVVRLTASGDIDNTFGTVADGLASASINLGDYHSYAASHALTTSDGNIVFFVSDAVAKLNSSGQLDDAFGRITSYSIREWPTIQIAAVAPQPDGSLLLVGATGTDHDIVNLYKLQGSGITPSPISLLSGVLSITGTENSDGFEARVAADDQSIIVSQRNTFGRVFDAAGVSSAVMAGGAGNDEIISILGDLPVSISGGDGSDHLMGLGGNTSISGNAGADSIFGDTAGQRLAGNGGRDHIAGFKSRLLGGGGDDLIASIGQSTIDGGAGNDHISAGEWYVTGHPPDSKWQFKGGPDIIRAGDGNDTIISQNNQIDVILGGHGTDTVMGDDTDDLLSIESVDDQPLTPPT